MSYKKLIRIEPFKRPMGPVYVGEALEQRIKEIGKDTPIIVIGDHSGRYVLERHVLPKLLIYDNKIERTPTDEKTRKLIASFVAQQKAVVNPPGCISDELVDAITHALHSRGRWKIFVEGEEDLAALVVFMHASEGTIILYGQPGRGIVITPQTKERREYAMRLFADCFV